jgi:hypothetical protein
VALDVRAAEERSMVLAASLEAHPDLVGEAESEAHRLVSATTVDDVAADVSSTLRMIPLEDLAARAGRVRGRGYVHETDAAWEIVEEAVEPFLADMRRRASLGLAGPASVVATGIVAGLYVVDPPDEGCVLAYAGPDVPGELADAVLDEAGRLGLDIDPEAPGRYWPRWDQLG